ncbi:MULTISPECIES: dimethylarginine dimethylaminohydrolase family protein [unclassified Nocardioides]|uniref:dimethylarginine dimethylaminohydrolase family protein n=1 Tax=unclassified Nocardioides TaxID=2615069 RepID=UPI0006F89AB8|nr:MULTISPECIES: arginine deiminase family protein [unclassified Nocardioides]KRA38769.1 amidinotransferase [Nocardioides sp. Root614]KRA92729.1 amidinotransferase [Nocardioides sp. Root682]
MTATLEWGQHYAMVEPSAFRIDYAINPYMDPAVQPDAGRARAQWDELAATLRALGATVDEIPALPEAPDMVYAMNLGLVALRPDWTGPGRRSVVMSHMRYPQRRIETPAARAWFESHAFAATHIGRDGIGADFESGDAFPFRGELVVGHGPRTDELALRQLADDLGVQVRGVHIVHPGMYHLDLAFCPLDDDHALICPSAFDEASAAALMAAIPQPIVLSEEEALGTWCANSVVVGRTVVMPACPPRVRNWLETLGFEIVLVDVSEFHLGGGSIRCLTNPLDITVGRDLEIVSGGRVVVPGAVAA